MVRTRELCSDHVLVEEQPDGALGYDKMTSFFAPYGNAETLVVARDFDGEVRKLVRDAAG